jgi:hypothetical protein
VFGNLTEEAEDFEDLVGQLQPIRCSAGGCCPDNHWLRWIAPTLLLAPGHFHGYCRTEAGLPEISGQAMRVQDSFT